MPKDKDTEEIKLTPKQEAFCRQYIAPHTTETYKTLAKEDKPFNGTRAAIRAGYAAGSADVRAAELLGKSSIQKKIAQLQRPTIERYEASHDQLISKLNRLAMANIADFIQVDPDTGEAWTDLSKCTPEQMQVIGQFEVVEMPPQKYVENGEEVVREVIRTKIKLKDDYKPLRDLLDHHNLLNQKQGELNVNIKSMDKMEIARRVAFGLRKAQNIKVPMVPDNSHADGAGAEKN